MAGSMRVNLLQIFLGSLSTGLILSIAPGCLG